VICGPIDFYDDVTDSYNNPNLIIKVLSKSTEKIDRNDKFAMYRMIDSFSEYLLVSQDKVEVEVHRKKLNGRWVAEVYTEETDEVFLEAIDCRLQMSAIYAKIDFE